MDNSMNASTNTEIEAGTAVDYKALYETSEKRRKDAQAALTPLQQESSRLKAELAVQSVATPIDVTEQSRLEDLKYSDPDAWRAEMNKSESTQAEAYKAAVDTKQAEIETEMSQAEVLASSSMVDRISMPK